MKPIKLSRVLKVVAQVGGLSVDTVAATGLLDIARANKLEIIDAALVVESYLSDIIGHFFFPTDAGKRSQFVSLVVETNWCSFSEKRKLVNHIIKETKLEENFYGIKLDEFSKLTLNVMTYRNAFAHGEFSTDGKTVWLKYYQAGTRRQELTDEYMTQVANDITLAQRQANVVMAYLTHQAGGAALTS